MFRTPAEWLAQRQLGIFPVHLLGPRIAASPELIETGSPPSRGCYPPAFIWHGGITIRYPKVCVVYWNGSIPYSKPFIEGAVQAITEGGFFNATTEFGGGVGKYDVTTYNLAQATGGFLDDATIQAVLTAAVGAGTLPRPDYQTCYLVLTPPGVTVTAFGVQSCQYFCGYHGALADGVSFYAVIPDNSCYNCHGPNDAQSVYTAIIAHELGEWVTDPNTNGGTGWADASCGENGDICAWAFFSYGSYFVQPLWTNSQQCLVPPYTGNNPPTRHPFATSFVVDQISPGTLVNAGDTISFRVTATKPSTVEGTTDFGFGGIGDKLHFTSTDGAALLPADYLMTYADKGRHSFVAGITFRTPGTHTFTVKSDLNPAITGTSVSFTVAAVNPPVSPPGSASIPVEAAQKHAVKSQALFQHVEIEPRVAVSRMEELPLETLSPRHAISPPAQLALVLEATREIRGRSQAN